MPKSYSQDHAPVGSRIFNPGIYGTGFCKILGSKVLSFPSCGKQQEQAGINCCWQRGREERDSRFSRIFFHFHFSFSISSRFNFTFTSRKRVKGFYFSLCTSRKRVKPFLFHFSFLELQRPTLAGPWPQMYQSCLDVVSK